MAKPDETAEKFVPDRLSHEALVEAASKCTACDLYKHATHAVIGEGAEQADIMLIGEQPGDQEDRKGHPFVGPAGAKLDEAFEQAGVDRDQTYVTNAVKHFKFEQNKGGRRIHQKPNTYEIEVCKPWLDAEIELVEPAVLVSLGTSAARSVLGKAVTISKSRGQLLDTPYHPLRLVVTYHPSAALRHPYASERERIFHALVDDLALAATAVG